MYPGYMTLGWLPCFSVWFPISKGVEECVTPSTSEDSGYQQTGIGTGLYPLPRNPSPQALLIHLQADAVKCTPSSHMYILHTPI